MLYDLGKGNMVNPYFAYGVVLLGCLGVFGFLCVVLAVAVRIGDLIIGW